MPRVRPPSSWRSLRSICLLLLAVGGCAQGAGCNLDKVAAVPLEPRNRMFTVPVTVDGHALHLLLDTGGARSLLIEATVRRLAIPQDGRTFTVMVGLAGGSPRPDANIASMQLGGVPLAVDRLPVSSFGGSPNIDGVLGLDILRDYDLDIDGPAHTLTLYHVRSCALADPPWSETALRVDRAATIGSWMEMPFEIDGISGMATVDTGATFTMIMPRMMRRLGLSEEALAGDQTVKLHVVAGEDAQLRRHLFGTVRLGPVTAHDAPILVMVKDPPALGGGRQFADAVIGQDLLRDRRVWFSLRTGRLYFSRRSGDPASAATGH